MYSFGISSFLPDLLEVALDRGSDHFSRTLPREVLFSTQDSYSCGKHDLIRVLFCLSAPGESFDYLSGEDTLFARTKTINWACPCVCSHVP